MRIFNSDTILENMMEDRDLAQEILRIYAESAAKILSAIEAATEDGDCDSARLHSHSLKGASSNVGAELLGQIAHEAETASKKGDMELVRTLLPRMKDMYRDFTAEAREDGWL